MIFIESEGNSNYPFRVLTCLEVPKIKFKKLSWCQLWPLKR